MLLVAGLGLVSTSCGAAEPSNSFDQSFFVGTFDIVELRTDDTSFALSGDPTVVINQTDASIAVDTNCNTHLGSYSLFESGTLSITLTGGTRRQCDGAAQRQDDSIVGTIEAVDTWTDTSETSITLSTADGDTIELQRS